MPLFKGSNGELPQSSFTVAPMKYLMKRIFSSVTFYL